MNFLDDNASSVSVEFLDGIRTLEQAALLELEYLKLIVSIFPEWDQIFGRGEADKSFPITLEKESFIGNVVKMRICSSNSDFRDLDSAHYTRDSIPNLYTTMNTFYRPGPKNPLTPHPDPACKWSVSFGTLGTHHLNDNAGIQLFFPLGIESRFDGIAKIIQLIEGSIRTLDPITVNYCTFKFNEKFWGTQNRIGWITYFSYPPLVEQILKHPRARPFHKGAFLQLSDDPADMMDDAFAKAAFDYAQTLAPYWPPLLSG